ncbi:MULTISPECIES: type II toxin-antitoxin system RelE/ParE family toxin [unclassified Gemella]|uniref:type II toxin-antitoxin system RelE family toxin n=1 Tax=unclassified Gemella TaxID=2624949 RepID=UPI001073C489|nr:MULTISPECIES: type II toxin-antitoxin system RelE/ParE family toxin [unclassified Gemella]MBF0710568.1 type II toxin-antitoxin system RelE/ParE family toxin [Gemella sp. GL1.1]MBF0746453.1 type II toxin-antitoxin system RelE/ParE family toxin [Gemella sp. 19428wG2_WT2a]NYS27912.1 type II toxin-antitoxin system RelE/ParE family toxin [Gemella sp. GL1]TFU60235.1 type II toxin-antitoxin system RelE/ParE family toxin [Gemella sp. WT2a]
MNYKLKISPKAEKQLKKMDKPTALLILKYLYKNVDGLENPREKGKGLTANRVGQWRYRIGEYRVICQIIDNELIVLALSVGHRKDVYK